MFYGHIIYLLKFPYYLYLDPIVYLDVVDQMFKCTRNYFLLGAFITLAASKGRWSGVQLDERPWLQLMYCTPVSGREVIAYFGVEKSRQKRAPEEVN